MENRRFAWDDTDPAGLAPSDSLSGDHIEEVGREYERLVENFAPTACELGVLARHYIERRYEVVCESQYYEPPGPSEYCFWAFAAGRLHAIAKTLGSERFEAESAHAHDSWERALDEAQRSKRQFPPCVKCGGVRNILDHEFVCADENDPCGTNRLCAPCWMVRRRGEEQVDALMAQARALVAEAEVLRRRALYGH
jgi:hypothetical protein